MEQESCMFSILPIGLPTPNGEEYNKQYDND